MAEQTTVALPLGGLRITMDRTTSEDKTTEPLTPPEPPHAE